MSGPHLNTLPLHALRVFEAAARLGSFKVAAAELAVTPAAVSHQIKVLEGYLGAVLFHRLNRGLRLTPAGEQLTAGAREAFEVLERSLVALGEAGLIASATTLSVSAAPSFAGKWLAPRLYRFQAARPDIELRLHASSDLVDLTRDASIDVAIRYGREPQDPRIQATPLWPGGEIVVVCAPSLADDLQTPSDLLRHSLLRTAAPPGAPEENGGQPESGWSAWLAAAGVMGAPARGPLFGSTQLTLEAAAAGRGVALSPRVLVEDDLAAGALVQPFDTVLCDRYSYWVLCRRSRLQEARIRAFLAWLMSEAAPEPASLPG